MAQVEGMPLTVSPDISTPVSIFAPRVRSSQSTPSYSAKRHTKELSLDTEYKGPIIPPSTTEHACRRTLVLCFDGTGDQFDNDNSNVVHLFSLLSKGDCNHQLVYYQAGIGTYTIPQIATPIASRLRKTVDMMFGGSLHHHVMGGYEFLMERYKKGDRISLFGFSRGAYTARALAGMIEKVGLLPAGNHQQVPFAYNIYMKDDELGWQQSVLFKKSFSMDIDINFVGVWDTVDSVGLIPRHLPFTKNNTCVKTFRHAISLDEHRVKFKANHFDQDANVDAKNTGLEYTPLKQRKTNWRRRFARSADASTEARPELDVDLNLREKKKINGDKCNKGPRLQEKYMDKTKKTDVLEVWFAGCHTDVGGGSVSNDTPYSLARIPLRWMIRQCFLADSGIQFDAERLHEVGLDPQTLYPIVRPRPPPLSVENVSFAAEMDGVTSGLGRNAKGIKSKLTTKLRHDAKHVCTNCPAGDFDADENGDGTSDDRTTRNSIASTKVIGTTNVYTEGPDQGQVQGQVPSADEEHEELHDALSPAFDQLALRCGWWILEILPLVHRHTRSDGTSVNVISINNGRPRVAIGQQKNTIQVHRSVRMRMEVEAELLALKKKYGSRVKFDCEPTWVD